MTNLDALNENILVINIDANAFNDSRTHPTPEPPQPPPPMSSDDNNESATSSSSSIMMMNENKNSTAITTNDTLNDDIENLTDKDEKRRSTTNASESIRAATVTPEEAAVTTSSLSKNIEEQQQEKKKTRSSIAEPYVESDDHLPRVQEELDRLNYANESINILELELEENKRQHAQLIESSTEQLTKLEKKIGSSVAKCRPYYELKNEVNLLKEKYLRARNRFETAQELYVAAKNMQMYAEENLENYEHKQTELSSSSSPSSAATSSQQEEITTNRGKSSSVSNEADLSNASASMATSAKIVSQQQRSSSKETLINMLVDAKRKVCETESSKQISDEQQIEAFKVYSEKQKTLESMEKDLKRSIEKSHEYFELKVELEKELKFSESKVDGLRSCLKEAKLAYQQALKCLEMISTEIHTQRQNSCSFKNHEQGEDEEEEEESVAAINEETVPETTTMTTTATKAAIETSSSSSLNDDTTASFPLSSSSEQHVTQLQTMIYSSKISIGQNLDSNIEHNEIEVKNVDDDEEDYSGEEEADYDKYFRSAIPEKQQQQSTTEFENKTPTALSNKSNNSDLFYNLDSSKGEDEEEIKDESAINTSRSNKNLPEAGKEEQTSPPPSIIAQSPFSVSSASNSNSSSSNNSTSRPQFRLIPNLLIRSNK